MKSFSLNELLKAFDLRPIRSSKDGSVADDDRAYARATGEFARKIADAHVALNKFQK